MIALSAGLLNLAGAFLVYLAAPHQRLLECPLGPRGLFAGLAALLLSLALLLRLLGPATAVFVLVTGVMAFWSIAPLVIGWWRTTRKVKG